MGCEMSTDWLTGWRITVRGDAEETVPISLDADVSIGRLRASVPVLVSGRQYTVACWAVPAYECVVIVLSELVKQLAQDRVFVDVLRPGELARAEIVEAERADIARQLRERAVELRDVSARAQEDGEEITSTSAAVSARDLDLVAERLDSTPFAGVNFWPAGLTTNPLPGTPDPSKA